MKEKTLLIIYFNGIQFGFKFQKNIKLFIVYFKNLLNI